MTDSDTSANRREMGKIVDDFWLVQEKHGKRPPADTWASDRDPVAHRRVHYSSGERSTADAPADVETQEPGTGTGYLCNRVGRAPFKVECASAALTHEFNTKGLWQTS